MVLTGTLSSSKPIWGAGSLKSLGGRQTGGTVRVSCKLRRPSAIRFFLYDARLIRNPVNVFSFLFALSFLLNPCKCFEGRSDKERKERKILPNGRGLCPNYVRIDPSGLDSDDREKNLDFFRRMWLRDNLSF